MQELMQVKRLAQQHSPPLEQPQAPTLHPNPPLPQLLQVNLLLPQL